MLASAGSVFDNSNASPDGDSQAAAPASPPGPIRSPAMRKPYVPPSMRLSATASGPPNNSNAAGFSNSPFSLPNQVLMRGLPCTPPDVAPTTASPAPPHAPEENTCCGPYAEIGCTGATVHCAPSTLDHMAGSVEPSPWRSPPRAYQRFEQRTRSPRIGREPEGTGRAAGRHAGPLGWGVHAVPASSTATASTAAAGSRALPRNEFNLEPVPVLEVPGVVVRPARVRVPVGEQCGPPVRRRLRHQRVHCGR